MLGQITWAGKKAGQITWVHFRKNVGQIIPGRADYLGASANCWADYLGLGQLLGRLPGLGQLLASPFSVELTSVALFRSSTLIAWRIPSPITEARKRAWRQQNGQDAQGFEVFVSRVREFVKREGCAM